MLCDDIRFLTERAQLESNLCHIRRKIDDYLDILTDSDLAETPEGCDMSRMRLIMGQIRHWHRHMGIVYGFIIADEGKCPYVLNMRGKYPDEPMPNYY